MDDGLTLDFDSFWQWLATHPNCILRAGTPEAVVYDDDDLYWYFTTDVQGLPMVQVLRGKRIVGELFMTPDQVSYVTTTRGEADGEVTFELISETEDDRFVAYFFVLVHGYEEEAAQARGRVH